jgi:CheY-like chemotaxis protein
LLERHATLDEQARQVVDLTRRSAKQGAELVSRMLAFSRRQNLNPAAVRLASLGDTMNGLVAPVLGGLIRFEWKVDDSVWTAHVDVGQLELALMNLVFNARDAMPSGGTITVLAQNRVMETASEDLMPGDYVVVSVRDTGVGIPKDILAKVVEPFFTTKPVGKGTGLGLSTVYGFMKQSGGSLRIDSAVGRGTAMELWLPRSIEQPADDIAEPEVTPADAYKDLPSILLVDDSSALRQLTAQSLRQHGFAVTCAASGAEALAIIEKAPQDFDVIVTDFAMPLVSGVEVIRFARNLRSEWPAIIITGYADPDAIIDRPADVPLLNKPFHERDLIENIVQLTSHAAQKTVKIG